MTRRPTKTLLVSQNWRKQQMFSRIVSLMGSVLLALMLTACASSLEQGAPSRPQTIRLANVPNDIQSCFTQLTGEPMPGSLSRKQIVELITALRLSEQRKSACGKRLLALYNQQSKAWSKR